MMGRVWIFVWSVIHFLWERERGGRGSKNDTDRWGGFFIWGCGEDFLIVCLGCRMQCGRGKMSPETKTLGEEFEIGAYFHLFSN